jgi:hypothetical protein
MSSSITDALKTTFDLASLRHEAHHLRRASDWEKARGIKDQFQSERQEQEKQYYATYDMRVESVVKTLIDRRAAVTKDHKYRRFGHDGFNRSLLVTQAHRLVQQDHQRRVLKINEREASALDELIAQVRQRDAATHRAKDDFNRSADHEQMMAAYQTDAPSSRALPTRQR